ncbi:WD40 repeat protein [Elasticomyces elasticus]|uniref:WD40 repeat protein n=1 Tax=Exophiala sideris TaxID=1016849 RepID=A0ABR0IWJ2_9EURO|nr:WD40 repeat protein [Elasticomyces elasticus]KAK5021583.1 WD40 repeat protein [Exophiala sideris]KAK5024785.1 WD40 repeat protein [Exophiala sideris]KAK5049720.1 WD40 repeat protein [Exophiala sideris]KAK5176701.1 WD40 repeat protein [Eurotiomycetes sp. CCFEE 6388]
MYWPCGVPQVFAYHGPTPEADEEETETAQVNDTDEQTDSDGLVEKQWHSIIDVQAARSDHLFATLTQSRLDVWSTRPVVLLASLARSSRSLQKYGHNVSVVFKPDATTIVIRTRESYLITYSLEVDPNARVLQQQYGYSQAKRQNLMRNFGIDETAGVGEVLLRFRRAIKIDAGINSVIALDSELIVATTKPAAVQCIKWETQKDGSQAVAQLLTKTDWMTQRSAIATLVHDRAMNLSVWLSQDGHAYAVQRIKPLLSRAASSDDSLPSSRSSTTPSTRLFDGYCFHKPEAFSGAIFASINARFSLIAVATISGEIICYAAKDYVGNIPLSHTFKASSSPTSRGAIKRLMWSPDGYCLFAGYEHGWSTWSVFGKEGASSFQMNPTHAKNNNESWLFSIERAIWISGGAELLLTSHDDDRIWKLEMSRTAAMGCFSCANLVRALIQTPLELTVYRGHELPDLTSISNEASLWHHAPYPPVYLHNQWPIKSCVISQDGKYVAIAGRRGLAHYSLQSGRWKTFPDIAVENSFAVRGGMCWFNHILAVATEHAAGYDLRLYSRELDLDRLPLHSEAFSMPIVFVGPSGEDSLLVYTYENVLYHYILNITEGGAQLVQVGQIAFHGIVRAPSRVRSVSWVVPDVQLRNGDPSRDVEYASVLFLVDDKLVLLQSSRNEKDELKYDMRVIAQHVEYYILMRDQIYFNFDKPDDSAPPTPSPGAAFTLRSQHHYSMRDSLWIFSGEQLRLWPDVRDLLHHAAEGDLSTSSLLAMSVDFYPLSILLTKGVVLGIESELLQRRDVNFAQFRLSIRTQLFLPYVLRQQLCEEHDTAAAFGLANQYQHLSYFPHALEILLHHVLDDDVNRTRKSDHNDESPGPLPTVLSFLQLVLPPTTYLSTIVQCIRKNELTSWKTLFAHLPPPLTLFEQALELEDLKTASGYLIVLQGLEEDDESESNHDASNFEDYVIRLMRLARRKSDFEMCSDLARFMIGVDPRGDALKRVIAAVGFGSEPSQIEPKQTKLGGLRISTNIETGDSLERSTSRLSPASGGDYFSASPGGL